MANGSRSYGEGSAGVVRISPRPPRPPLLATARGRSLVAARTAQTGAVSRLVVRPVALVAALLLGLLGLWVAARPAVACECAGFSLPRALRQADAVFRGTLVDRDDVGRGAEARTDLRFRVDTVYKGTAHREQVVATPRDDDQGCGVSPDDGATWVVFAVEGVEGSGDDTVSRLVTTRCSGNLLTGDAPALLGPGRPPLEGRSDRAERATNADRTLSDVLRVAGLAGLVVVVLGGVGLALLWRRQPPSRP